MKSNENDNLIKNEPDNVKINRDESNLKKEENVNVNSNLNVNNAIENESLNKTNNNVENSKEEKNDSKDLEKFPYNVENASWKDFLYDWSIKFAKVFGIRSLIVIFQNKSLLFKFHLFTLFKKFFEFTNIRTVMSITFIPLLYKLINQFSSYLNYFENQDTKRRIISIFISSFISIMIEERTSMVSFVVLAIFVRVIHNVCNHICKRLNIFQDDSKLNSYIIFTFSSLLWFLCIFLNPTYKPIAGLSDKYSNHIGNEKAEMEHIRNITRLV